jgi:Ca2+/H+ antiporter, TMEM165/GDT1 family
VRSCDDAARRLGARDERLMATALAYLAVLLAAAVPFLEVLVVVPAGIVAGLSPAGTVVVAAAGNVATLVLLVVTGDRLRSWWRRGRRRVPAEVGVGTARDGPRATGTDGSRSERSPRGAARARRVFERYGLPGLAALGPLLTGAHVAAVVALAAGAPRRRTVLWLSGGVVAWAVVAATATLLGVEAFVDTGALPDLFATPSG